MTQVGVAPSVEEAHGSSPHPRHLPRIIVVVVIALALLPFAAAWLSLAEGWQPTGDVGIIGLRARDVGTADTPLLGQPTTSSEYTQVTTWHPGPAQYWALAPSVRLLGPRLGLMLGVALINSAAILATLLFAWRRGGSTLVALAAVTLALVIHSLGLASLVNAYNSEFPTYLLFATIMALWSILQGDLLAVPVLVIASSLAMQAHVAIATQLALPVLIAVGTVGVYACTGRPAKREWWAIGLGLCIGIAMWAPVVAQELSAGPSNLSATNRSAAVPIDKAGTTVAVERLASALRPPPVFTRSHADQTAVGTITDRGLMVSMVVLGASGSLALAGARTRGRHAAITLAALLAVFVAGCVVSTAQTPSGILGLRTDALRWLWIVGAWVWLSIAWSAWRLLGQRRATSWAPKLTVLCTLVIAVLVGMTLHAYDGKEINDGPVMAAVGSVAAETIERTDPGTYHLSFGDPPGYLTVGPGLALLLDGSGRRIEVDPGVFTLGYGHDRTTMNKDVKGQLRVTTEPDAEPQPGEVLVASERAARGTDVVVKVFLSR